MGEPMTRFTGVDLQEWVKAMMAETVARPFTLGEFRRITEGLPDEATVSLTYWHDQFDRMVTVAVDEIQIRHLTDADPSIVLGVAE